MKFKTFFLTAIFFITLSSIVMLSPIAFAEGSSMNELLVSLIDKPISNIYFKNTDRPLPLFLGCRYFIQEVKNDYIKVVSKDRNNNMANFIYYIDIDSILYIEVYRDPENDPLKK